MTGLKNVLKIKVDREGMKADPHMVPLARGVLMDMKALGDLMGPQANKDRVNLVIVLEVDLHTDFLEIKDTDHYTMDLMIEVMAL